MSELNPLIMMALEQMLGSDKDAPIEQQAAPVIAIERSFSAFLQQKKAEYADQGYLVTMVDARPDGMSIAVHCIMYDILKKWKIEQEKSLAILDAAFRTLALGEANPERQNEIRQVHEQMKEVVQLTASGNLIGGALLDLGVNLTNTAANIPLLELAISIIKLIKSDRNEDGTVTIDPNMILGPIRTAARAPHCRLVQQEQVAQSMPEGALIKDPIEQIPVAVVTDEPVASAIVTPQETTAFSEPKETIAYENNDEHEDAVATETSSEEE